MAKDKNLSAVLYEKMDIRLEERPIPKPGPEEVLIEINSVGICGSDVHFWTKGAIGNLIVKAPMVLGHECSGTVKEIGSNVKHLKRGDRVAIEPGVPCRYCQFCKDGRYNLCPDVHFCATPPHHGTLTRYYAQAADFCYKLPDNVSFEEAALLEPISVAIQACKRANVKIGQKVLICGAGPIGLVNFMIAKTMGAKEVCITDINQNRLNFAKTLGVDHILLIDPKIDAKVNAERVKNQFGGDMADVTIECSGAESSVQLGIYATKSGGVVQLVGLGPSEAKIPIIDAAIREVDIRGSFRYANCYPTALSLVATGQVNVKPMVTHRFKLEETLRAFETAHSGADNAVKVMINCAK